MKKIILLVICALNLVLSSSVLAWDQKKEKDGIRVFTKEIQGSDFKAFKGETTINANVSQVLAEIKNVESMDEWLHECSLSQRLESSDENEIIVYQETNAPWPVSDRNFVLRMLVEEAEDGSQASIEFSALVEPETSNDDCVRVTELTGSWNLSQQDDNTVFVVYQTSADPAGDVPAWLANAFVVDQPFNTLANLRKRVEEKHP